MKRLYAVIVSVCIYIGLNAQALNDTSKVFNLGEVTITEKGKDNNGSSLLKRELDIQNVNSVSKAVEYIPGISLSLVGGRNEALVYVRGFDLKQVPVFYDGIPVSVPYDGYFDLSQIQLGAIEKLTVEKGNASLLYGANTMGGAINIVSAKPDKKLVVGISSGMSTGLGSLDKNMQALQIGSKHEKWYAIATFSYKNQNRITLPKSFDTTVNEQNRVRDNSQSENLNYNVKVGITPKEGQEYSVSLNGVRSSKGIPVYLGENPATRVRFWRYPNWDKDGIYFHSKNTLTPSLILKTRWYYDTYYNVLKSFDDNNYDAQTFGYAFTSTYDDYQLGSNVELGVYHFKNHHLAIGTQFKYSNHTEFNKGEQPREIDDITYGFGAEDKWQLNDEFSISAGAGLFVRKSLNAETYFSQNDSIASFEVSTDKALNAQIGAEYAIDQHNLVVIKLARKTRFATMKDRYSYRIGQALPNPDLNAETSVNTEIGYQASYEKLQIRTAAFYSFISNTIQQVDNVVDDLWQLQNTGESRFIGFELGANYNLTKMLTTGINYSFIDQQNISNPDLYFIDVPKHQLLGFLRMANQDKFFANIEIKYNSSRYSTTDGEYTADAFMIVNVNAEYNLAYGFSVNAGVQNVFDKLYYYAEGYPEPGRVVNVGVRYRFETKK